MKAGAKPADVVLHQDHGRRTAGDRG
jgi:hypothetical protein